MFHSKLRPLPALEAAVIHPLNCGCEDCALERDPIAFAKARRVVRFQAIALVAFAVAIYGALAACTLGTGF